jgi:cytochrome c553
MKSLLALAGVVLAAASGPAVSQSLGLDTVGVTSSEPEQVQANPVLGRDVAMGGAFGGARVACAACHQLDGLADPSGAFPQLAGQNGWYLYSSLRNFAEGARTSDIMGPVARELDDPQMQAVSRFYAGRPLSKTFPHLGLDQAVVDKGATLASSGLPAQGVPGCTSCHGDNANPAGPLYPALAGQPAVYLRDQLIRFKAGQRQGDPMRVMETIAGKLSDQQIDDAAAYYASLQPIPPALANDSAAGLSGEPARQAVVSTHLGATKDPVPGKPDEVVPDGAMSGQR